MSGRAEIVQGLQTLAAEWRGRLMSDEAQRQFDTYAMQLAALDAEDRVREQEARQQPTPAPLADRLKRARHLTSEADRTLAVQDMQALAAEYRARSMPDEVMFAFDGIVAAIDDYDARRKVAASARPDPRDAILHGMRARVQGVPGW